MAAIEFIIEERNKLCKQVAKRTNQYQYRVNQIIEDLAIHCFEKGMYLKKSPKETKMELLALLTENSKHTVQQNNGIIM
jgi:tRNA U54 and U55 pseudouridine synthase Pus10